MKRFQLLHALLLSATSLLIPGKSTLADTVVNGGSVTNFFGPADLDLTGNFAYAINLNGDSDQTINGLTFKSDNNPIPGYDRSQIPYAIGNWGTQPNFGASADQQALSQVMWDMRWGGAYLKATLDVVPATNYKLQLLWNENAQNNRYYDIRVAGQDLVDEVSSLGLVVGNTTPTYSADKGTAFTYTLTAAGNKLDIEMGSLFGATVPVDHNPVLAGLTLEELPSTTLTWDGLGNGNWNSATQWTGGNPGDTPSPTVNAVVVSNTVTASGPGNNARALTINSGSVSIPVGGSLTVAANANLNAGSLLVDGSLSVAGALNSVAGSSTNVTGSLQATSADLHGDTSLGGSSTTTVPSTLKFSGGTNYIGAGATINTPTVEAAGGTLNTAALNLPGELKATGATVVVSGAIAADKLSVSAGSVSSVGGNLATSLTVFGGSYSTTANVTVPSAVLTSGTTNTNGNNLIISNTLVSGDSKFVVTGGTITASGTNLSSKPDVVGLNGGVVAVSQTPTLPSVAGLSLHLDANTLVGAEGSAIGVWQDLSGNGNNAVQASPPSQPVLVHNGINGLPTVHFGGNQTINTDANFNTPYTILTVSKLDGTQNARLITSANVNWLLGTWGGQQDVLHANGWVQFPGPTATADPHLYVASSNGSVTSFYSAGNLLASNGGGVSNIGRLGLGGWQTTSEFSKGDVSEVLIYDHVLSASDMNSVGYYLSDKYGFASSYTGTPNQVDLTTTSFNVHGNTTLSLTSGAHLGNLSFDSGTQLTVSGTAATVSFENVQGNGTLVGPNLEIAGTLTPGNSIGTLVVNGNLVLSGTYQVELVGGAIDLLDNSASGTTLDITGGTVDFSYATAPNLYPHVFAKYDNLVGTFQNVLNLPPRYYIDYHFQGNQIALVPEPAAGVLLLLGAAGILRIARRRALNSR